ncbi:MAG: hypothetical protein KDF54_12885 [Hydrogenophaga sp.]|nr:hypothetical protein [Hydrogenophaga sp.]
MNRLDTERQRLFHLDDGPRAEGRVKAAVLGLSGPADWGLLSAVWRGVQAELDLPAPAIAVNGVDAFELWFALAEPMPAATAAAFLDGLCTRFLSEVAPARRRLWPSTDPGLAVEPASIPQWRPETDRWSAFVAPDLAAVFGDDPSLDIPPGDDAQAELLSRIAPVSRAEFQIALARLTPEPSPFSPDAIKPVARAVSGVREAPVADRRRYEDPRAFLVEVMNDPSVAMVLRVQAAQALLGHREKEMNP